MEQIFLPTTIEFQDADQPNTGKVLISPCHQGYGATLGNALRRVLLSSLPGAAVESVKIEGVQHEFSTIEGVLEDVVQIILNLKQLAVRCFSDEPVTLSLTKKGAVDVTAADFEKNADVEIANPDLKIATITDKNTTLDMEITVAKGRGYVPVEKKESKDLDLGIILIDSLYTPIRDVGYNVELTRVGDITDYEKLTLIIETNGTITPKEALQQATKILMDHFALVLDAGEGKAMVEEDPSADTPRDEARDRQGKEEVEEGPAEEEPSSAEALEDEVGAKEEKKSEEQPTEAESKSEEEEKPKPKKRGRKKKEDK